MIRLPGLRAPLNRGHFRAALDLARGRRKTVRVPRLASEDFVHQLTMLDGVISAIGWTTGADPILVYAGEPMPAQICVRYPWPQDSAAQEIGFRIAAVVPHRHPYTEIDNSKVAVRFDNGNTLRPLPKGQDVYALFAQFREMVAAKPAPSLIEIGSRARSGVTYRHLFPQDCRYLGIDIKDGPNVDLVTDAHTLAGVNDKFDFAYSGSVFEHLMMPWVAAQTLNRVLNVGAVAYIQSHPSWPLHEEPWDFFRFSKDSWKSIFNVFTGFEMIGSGYAIEGAIIPTTMDGGGLQGLDYYKTFLLTSCLVRKVGEPTVNWLVDPSEIYDLKYSH